MNLKNELLAFVPWNEQELQDQYQCLKLLDTEHDLYNRSNINVHITASPWIINKENTKVLFIHHNIYQSWGWCGGHADGDYDLQQVACKEGLEETGLKSLILYDKTIFAIDILPVPKHKKHGQWVIEHYHVNITYLFIADDQDALQFRPDENSGVMWIEKNNLNTYVHEEIMKPVYQKLIQKTALMYKK